MRAEGNEVSIARLCPWFGVPRSTFYHRGPPERRQSRAIDAAVVEAVRKIIDANPTYGLRRITALVRRELQAAVNRKKIHRILKTNGWQVRQRPQGKRPRVQAGSPAPVAPISARRSTPRTCSVAATAVPSHRDHRLCDRIIVGWRLSRSGSPA